MTDQNNSGPFVYDKGLFNPLAGARGMQNAAMRPKPPRDCPHPAGSPAAVLWQKLQDVKEHAAYCDAMIKQYMERKEIADSEAMALQNALDKLTA